MSTGRGKKRMKDTPVLYEGLKKKRNPLITDYAWHGMQEKAIKSGLSASEYLERLIRKDLKEHCE
ncbi:MAG: hypothetical protein AAF915_19530 [Cyanobacteria bacterium P01_D01_bin.50]